MRSLLAFVVLTSSLVSGMVHAQSTDTEIGQRLIGKPLLLRGFWAEDKLSFHADGTPAQSYGTRSFTESGIDVKSVQWKGDYLEIEGQRVGLVFDMQGNVTRLPLLLAKALGNGPEKLVIEVERGSDGDPQRSLDVIFTDKLSDIAESLPECWQAYARQHFLHEALPPGRNSFFTEGAPASEPRRHIAGSVKPPRPIDLPNPSVTEAARQRKISGNSQIYLQVSASGEPEHVRIARPLGLGLDEKAVEAVKKYRFAPATQNGTPVKVDMFIDVNFRIF